MLKMAAKIFFGLACLALLNHLGLIDFGVLSRAMNNPEDLIIAFLLLLLTVPLAAWRWKQLLYGVGADATFSWSLSTTFVGQFFNTFMPGAYGGDLVRFGLAVKAYRGRAGQIFLTIFVDRLAGLLALLLLAIAVLPFLPGGYHGSLIILSLALFGGLIASFSIAILAGGEIARWAERLPAPFGNTVAHLIRETLAALRAFQHRPGTIATVILISLAQYSIVLVALAAIGNAMGIGGLSASGYVVSGVWGLVANALPITPGGVGVGESAFSTMAAVVSSDPTEVGFANIFLASRVLTMFVSLCGLLPLLFGSVLVNKGEIDDAVRQSSLARGGRS